MEQSELLSRTFDTVFPLVFVVLVGFVYARWRSTDMTIANRINMDVFVPALIFSVMASGSFHVMQYKGLILCDCGWFRVISLACCQVYGCFY